jgi:uncharacterized membrane protein
MTRRTSSFALIGIGAVLAIIGVIDLVAHGPNTVDLGYGAILIGAIFIVTGLVRMSGRR